MADNVVVGSDNVDLIAKGSGPGADCVTGSGSVPSSAGGVLHFLRSQLTNNIGGAVYFDGTVFNDGGGAVGVGADRGGIDVALSSPIVNRTTSANELPSKTYIRLLHDYYYLFTNNDIKITTMQRNVYFKAID